MPDHYTMTYHACCGPKISAAPLWSESGFDAGNFNLPELVGSIDPQELNMINENADVPQRLINKCQVTLIVRNM